MKNTLLIALFLASTVSISAQAQGNAKYIKAMEKAVGGLDTLRTGAQWLEKSNQFERIAQKETGEWLPYYYVALCQAMIFNLDQDAAKYEALCDKAEKFLAVADSLNPNNSEVYVLKNMSAGMRIRINPMVNGQKYGPLDAKTIEQAIAIDTENQRDKITKDIE